MHIHFHKKRWDTLAKGSMALTSTLLAIPHSVFCNGEGDKLTPITDSTDIVETGVKAFGSVQSWLVSLSVSAFPVSLIVILFCLFFVHDTRKISGLLVVAGIVCLATFLILVVNAGAALELIKSLANLV